MIKAIEYHSIGKNKHLGIEIISWFVVSAKSAKALTTNQTIKLFIFHSLVKITLLNFKQIKFSDRPILTFLN
ncbi:hypothetical protein BCD67_22850 [Oscillatoriales cyanobacterium USR001]|nr:hypothetical protein BCD67_22850 [Oscillatoriales cyanobacterium USR001]